MAPHYEHRQVAWMTVVGFGSLTVTLSAILMSGGLRAGGVLTLALGALILLFFGWMTVRVDDETLRLHFGIGAVHKTVDLRHARSHRIVRNPWFYGWGIRLIPGGWLYNVQGLDAVEITLASGHVVRVGTNEPAALAAAVSRTLPETAHHETHEPAPDAAAVSAFRWLALLVPLFILLIVAAMIITLSRGQ